MEGATPLEIGEEAPLEVVAGAPLEVARDWDRMVWAVAAGTAIASSERGRGVY